MRPVIPSVSIHAIKSFPRLINRVKNALVRSSATYRSGKDGRLVKKDYEKILKMYKNKAVLELIKESTTYTVKELKAKIADMGFNKKDYILMLYITLALLKKKPRAQ